MKTRRTDIFLERTRRMKNCRDAGREISFGSDREEEFEIRPDSSLTAP
jgi:hypothetical protein